MHFIFLFQFSQLRKYFSFFPSMKHSFLDRKQYVGAGRSTLMSFSDGLGPAIFCRKMERARLMREEMDGKVIYFPLESHF